MLVPPLNLIFRVLPLLLLMSSVRTEMPELGSPPPFKHNYRFEINTSYIQRPRAIDAVPFTCSWFGFGPDRVVCTGTACSGKPLRCADVNASYILLAGAPPASCTWTPSSHTHECYRSDSLLFVNNGNTSRPLATFREICRYAVLLRAVGKFNIRV